MIITDKVVINGKEFIRNYSSLGFLIERDGVKYEEAVDLPENNYVYIETTEYLNGNEEATVEDYQKVLQRMGVEV